jgi:magnesium transporter
VRTIYYRSPHDKKLEEISEIKPGCWINIENATKSDLEALLPLTGLEYIDIDDSIDHFEIPRFEKQRDYTIVFVRNPSREVAHHYTEILTVLFSDKYIITISPAKNSTIAYLLEKNILITTTQTKMFINLLLNIAQQFTYEIKQVRNVVLQGKKPIGKIDNSDFIALSESEEILNQYLASLIPLNNLIEAISSSKHITFHESDRGLLEDTQITFRQSADICKVSVNSIVSLRDSYQVIFTNNLNKIIKLLTSLTIILTIPTLISSIFGMNVRLPLNPDSTLSFPIILLLIAVSSSIVLFIFNWKRWL